MSALRLLSDLRNSPDTAKLVDRIRNVLPDIRRARERAEEYHEEEAAWHFAEVERHLEEVWALRG